MLDGKMIIKIKVLKARNEGEDQNSHIKKLNSFTEG